MDRSYPLLAVSIFVLALLPLVAPLPAAQGESAAPPKHPVPDGPAEKSAARQVDELFKSDLAAAKSAKAKTDLAARMLETAATSGNDVPGRYALCIAARNLDASAGNVAAAFEAVGKAAEWFEIDEIKMKAEALSTALKSPREEDSPFVSTQDFDTFIDAAVAADRYDIARQSLDAIGSFAARSSDSTLKSWAATRKRDVEAIVAAQRTSLAAEATLRTMPDDAGAALTAGRFRSLFKNDWHAGLPLLARGKDDPVLQALARDDLAEPASASAKVQLGDRWLAFANREPGPARRNASLRAAKWYREALPDLEGLSKLAVEKKLTTIASGQADTAHGWIVLFRSADPALWNTNTNAGRTRYAIDESHFPKDVRYLKLSAGGARVVIIPITTDELTQANHARTRFAWNGLSNNAWGGRHLGICDTAVNMGGKGTGFIDVYSHDSKMFKGWGFGDKPGVGDKQYFAWDSKEIEPTAMEISVKTEPLSLEETKVLLK